MLTYRLSSILPGQEVLKEPTLKFDTYDKRTKFELTHVKQSLEKLLDYPNLRCEFWSVATEELPDQSPRISELDRVHQGNICVFGLKL